MKPGDTVQVKQNDLAIVRRGEQAVPTTFWIFATVQQVLPDGAFVEINHPANIEHGARKKVLSKDLRTLEQLQAIAATHPDKDLPALDFQIASHRELNDARAAITRIQPAEDKAA